MGSELPRTPVAPEADQAKRNEHHNDFKDKVGVTNVETCTTTTRTRKRSEQPMEGRAQCRSAKHFTKEIKVCGMRRSWSNDIEKSKLRRPGHLSEEVTT